MKHILISRTDAIGDVVLTIPMAGFLKKEFPGIRITFVCASYTREVVKASNFVDAVITKEELPASNQELKADSIILVFPDPDIVKWSKKAGIPIRVGTSHRLINFFYLNRRVNFSRRRSDLHEAQLNFKLLKGIGIDYVPDLQQIADWYGFAQQQEGFSNSPKELIIHPKSRGSAREWPLEEYLALIRRFDPKEITFKITGTQAEGGLIKKELPSLFDAENVEDLTGRFSLSELIEEIKKVDGFVAASTGPLHLASASGVAALGLFPPLRPMDPGRWAPIGKKASWLTSQQSCNSCNGDHYCQCMQNLQVTDVEKWIREKVLKQ